MNDTIKPGRRRGYNDVNHQAYTYHPQVGSGNNPHGACSRPECSGCTAQSRLPWEQSYSHLRYENAHSLSEARTIATSFEAHLPVTKLDIKAETVRNLTRMFPLTIAEYAAKPLDWRTFVIVMEDAGFPATHSGGSAVVLIHQKGDGGIVLHRPHHVYKIDQTMLQGFGKRMRKWFRWEREFCLQEERRGGVGGQCCVNRGRACTVSD